jgi:hypothetical protein
VLIVVLVLELALVPEVAPLPVDEVARVQVVEAVPTTWTIAAIAVWLRKKEATNQQCSPTSTQEWLSVQQGIFYECRA